MTDPVTTAVATALAAKAVAGLTEAGKITFNALARLVRRKLAADAESSEILHHAQAYPTSDVLKQALAEALARAMIDDRRFAVEVASLWRQVQEGGTGTSHGNVLNVVSGDVDGSLVQARDIHGNVSFG